MKYATRALLAFLGASLACSALSAQVAKQVPKPPRPNIERGKLDTPKQIAPVCGNKYNKDGGNYGLDFQWSPVKGAGYYLLSIWGYPTRSGDTMEKVVTEQKVNATSIHVTLPKTLSTYQWKVEAMPPTPLNGPFPREWSANCEFYWEIIVK